MTANELSSAGRCISSEVCSGDPVVCYGWYWPTRSEAFLAIGKVRNYSGIFQEAGKFVAIPSYKDNDTTTAPVIQHGVDGTPLIRTSQREETPTMMVDINKHINSHQVRPVYITKCM